MSVFLSVKSHFTSGASVRPENTVTYSAASPLAEWLCVPSGQRLNVGLSPTVGAVFVCCGCRADSPFRPSLFISQLFLSCRL